MKNQYVWWIAIVVLVVIIALGIYKVAKAEEVLSCPTGQKVASVLVTPEVVSVPAVTHTETVIDTPAWVETVVDRAAYTTCDWAEHGATYSNSICTNTFGTKHWVKVSHPAVTHTVNHPAVTHEVIVVDVPAVVGTPAVYENQCVTDESYVAPAPAPAPKVSSGSQGGTGRCDRVGKPTCAEFFANLGISYGQGTGGTSVVGPQQQLINLLNQLIVLLQKQIALQ